MFFYKSYSPFLFFFLLFLTYLVQIPTTLAKPVLPTLYLLYISTFYLYSDDTDTDNDNDEDEDKEDKKNPNALLALCCSLPTSSSALNWSNFAINTLLLVATLDLALTPFFDPAFDTAFTRVGAVYPDSVKIQVRRPHNDSLLVLYREAVSTEWKDGPVVNPHESLDWVDTVRLVNLWPSTRYECKFFFFVVGIAHLIVVQKDVIANLNKTILDVSTKPVTFTTFPDPRLASGSHFRFIASSCITPNFPYRGPWNKRSIPGFDLLADYLEQISTGPLGLEHMPNETNSYLEPPSLDFLLFLGDFIYADVPLYIGDDKSAYQRLYRRNYASPSFRRVYEQLRMSLATLYTLSFQLPH